MKLIIDCMGGDKAPLEMLKGVIDAKAELGGDYLLVGNKTELETVAKENKLDISGFDILHAETVVTMEDEPMAVREKKDSSMAVGLRALANGEGDAMVSSGNTGALFTGASLTVRRIKGVHRAAIAAVLPFQPPVLLLDAGANVIVQPQFMVQFATMGSAYMKALYGLENPRVGLLNNGTEEHKGTPLHTEAYQLLKNCPDINFVGNVESSTLPFDVCDVLVTDGFTGNILLKSLEGMGKLIMTRMKGIFYTSPITKLAALTVKKPFMQFKKDFDVKEHGGSPILGLRKPVIKAHGSSDARAFKSAIRQAMRFAESGATDTIEALLGEGAQAGKE
ncbi:MAG: phosphate acyltransferase PlsX [Clostridia bacterium]|nr:phosphate acyltransferase PlsX [Clostridia bacterium]